MRVFYVPIEPLEERYTKQWYVWFPQKFKSYGIDCITIEGEPLTNRVEVGEFLDINSTLAYKSSQLRKIAELFHTKQIVPGDTFYIADLEFWGVESIKYLSVLNKIPVKIFGFMHAGSYDVEDFMNPCRPFAQYFEQGWFSICEKIFVGSQYHKELLKKSFPNMASELEEKVIVTGNPWNTKEALCIVGKFEKRNQIIHSNLPDWRKRPNLFLNLVPLIKKARPDVNIVLTTSRREWGTGWLRNCALDLQEKGYLEIKEDLLKSEYYKILAESKVMFSATMQETFGYCIVEAMTFDTIPIVPNRLSCPEVVNWDSRLLYKDLDEALEKVFFALDNKMALRSYAKKYDTVIDRMIEIMFGVK